MHSWRSERLFFHDERPVREERQVKGNVFVSEGGELGWFLSGLRLVSNEVIVTIKCWEGI